MEDSVPFNHPGTRGSFHSPRMGDCGMDDDKDILTIDRKYHLILPKGAAMTASLWGNTDGKEAISEAQVVPEKMS